MANREAPTRGTARQVEREPFGLPRIVFLHYSAPPIVGGVEAVIAQQVRLFSEAGYPTLILAGRSTGETEAGLGPIHILPEIDSENPAYLNARHSLDEETVSQQFLDLQETIEHAMETILKPNDIVLAHNVMTTHLNLALTAAVHHLVSIGRFPHLVIWCHDLSRHVNPEREEVQHHGSPWDLLRTRLAQAAYVAVSTSRQGTLAKILGCPPKAIRVIPNGVDPVELLGLSPLGSRLVEAYGLFSVDLVLLMPVRITRAKNIEFALRVAAAIKQAGRTVRLVVTGPPDPHVSNIMDYFASLLQLRDELSLKEQVRFVYEGTSEHDTPLVINAASVAELYRIADVMLMPSLREGFGMPVLEASLVDRPVFATPVPATQELPDFQYVIASDETPESVASRILRWADDDSAHHLRTAVRREFTWIEIFTHRILPLIRTLESAESGSAE